MSVSLIFCTCVIEQAEVENEEVANRDIGGNSPSFKIPLPKGFEWKVTQSWGEHAEQCDIDYPPASGEDYFVESSHNTSSYCEYGWDFSLPGSTDSGKPVLASGLGTLKYIGDGTSSGQCNGWGYCAIIDHQYKKTIDGLEHNVCSRYAHMIIDSGSQLEIGQDICQGLKIGEIGDTDSPGAYHLHFQFEDCDNRKPLRMGFTDGNGVPRCEEYLTLTNDEVESCGDSPDDVFGDAELPEGGWVNAGCGSLPDCPLIPNCNREKGTHLFSDYMIVDDVLLAAGYLYGECALDGKADGGLHPNDDISRAETLKVALNLFGLASDNCGDSESFTDVSPDDWFYDLVNCAQKYGIIESVGGSFYPSHAATFAEAAKVVVEAANQADVIEIKNAHELGFSGSSDSHWSLNYFATLYYYGGIDLGYLPTAILELPVKRKDFFIMAASLSPCFCGNVNCSSGCVCDQKVSACVDPDDVSDDTGGGDDVEEELEEKEFDLQIDCFVDVEHTRCEDSGTILYVKCDLENNGDEVVKLNNLVMFMSSSSEQCQVTDQDLHSGVGTQHVESGEIRDLNGHFEITCTDQPRDSEFEVYFDLYERIDGEVTQYEDILTAEIFVADEPFELCEEDTCTLLTCRVMGFSCGSYSDNCGGIISCGNCEQDFDCVDGRCQQREVCEPVICQILGYQCGNYNNNCGGMINCGNCGNGFSCQNGACVGIQEGVFDQDQCNLCPYTTPCDENNHCQAEGWYDDWVCENGYVTTIGSPGGRVEIETSGGQQRFYQFDLNPAMLFTFSCDELPVAIWIETGPESLSVEIMDPSLPYFSFISPPCECGVSIYPRGIEMTARGISLLVNNDAEHWLIRVPMKDYRSFFE